MLTGEPGLSEPIREHLTPSPFKPSLQSHDTGGSHLKAVSRNPSSALEPFLRELMILQAPKGRENTRGTQLIDHSLRITASGIPLV